jgi:hypothetical protein
MSTPGEVAARLAVEHATTSGAALLAARGIPTIALRGPALIDLLYDDEDARTPLDVDLLVPDLPEASAVLVDAGFERVVDWTPGMERHAWTHVREAAISIDLHRTLVGIEALADVVWSVFARESGDAALTGGTVRVPNRTAQALTVALHAAQHGRETTQTSRDLARALDRFDRPTWEAAATLAAELDALPAFAAGLSQLPEGGLLAAQLELPSELTRRDALRTAYGSAESGALGLDTLLTLSGRRRARFALGKVFPPAAFMRERYAVARRGAVGLGSAYVYRLGWLTWTLPKAVRRLRSVDRARSG